MDIGKILVYFKYKQFAFSLLVMYFLQYYKNFRQSFFFNLAPKVKGMFLFTIYKFFFFSNITISMGWSSAPRSEQYQLYRVFLTGKGFLS